MKVDIKDEHENRVWESIYLKLSARVESFEFEWGRIMKKELLEVLRNNSYSGWWLRYQDYSDRIIKGYSLTTDESSIWISPGTIKCNKFIFLICQSERVEY